MHRLAPFHLRVSSAPVFAIQLFALHFLSQGSFCKSKEDYFLPRRAPRNGFSWYYFIIVAQNTNIVQTLPHFVPLVGIQYCDSIQSRTDDGLERKMAPKKFNLPLQKISRSPKGPLDASLVFVVEPFTRPTIISERSRRTVPWGSNFARPWPFWD